MNTSPLDYSVYEKTLVPESGGSLRYTLAVPPSLSADRTYPLILALHYGGQVTPYYGKSYLINLVLPALRSLNAVLIAPDCPGEGWTDPASERAVMTLLQAVQKDYPIHPRKLIITGYSMGAVGTWDLVFKHPRLFTAAIPISGMPPKGIFVKDPGTPILVIHSRDDELFPLDPIRKFIQACEAQGLRIELRVVAGLSHYRFDQFAPALREAVPWLKRLLKVETPLRPEV
jgi:predicted peptidase